MDVCTDGQAQIHMTLTRCGSKNNKIRIACLCSILSNNTLTGWSVI